MLITITVIRPTLKKLQWRIFAEVVSRSGTLVNECCENRTFERIERREECFLELSFHSPAFHAQSMWHSATAECNLLVYYGLTKSFFMIDPRPKRQFNRVVTANGRPAVGHRLIRELSNWKALTAFGVKPAFPNSESLTIKKKINKLLTWKLWSRRCFQERRVLIEDYTQCMAYSWTILSENMKPIKKQHS